MMLAFGMLFAQLRKDFQIVESMFLTGNITEANERLEKLKPASGEERAFVMYYYGFQKTSSNEALNQYLATAGRHPKTKYGQLAMLEAAKIYILERDMDSAQAELRKINSPDITERFYWLACTNFYKDELSAAIANADNYLRLMPKGREAESAAYIIVDSYLEQKKYQSALSSLGRVRNIPNHDRQYFYYKQGYAHEMNASYKDALQSYQTGYEIDKYSQSAFAIEERLFEMRGKSSNLDLSFLYPYEPLEILEAEADETTVESNGSESPTPPVSVEKPTLPPLPPIVLSNPEKLAAKPSEGLYVQAGRFSVETNAARLVSNIRKMGINAGYLEESKDKTLSWVVLAGPFVSRDQAESVRGIFKEKDIDSFLTTF